MVMINTNASGCGLKLALRYQMSSLTVTDSVSSSATALMASGLALNPDSVRSNRNFSNQLRETSIG